MSDNRVTLPSSASPIHVSVIIPVYNREAHIRQCLDNVVNQTLRSIEIICVDDGSTDTSLAILKDYAARDTRFVVLTQENQGAGPARNYGINSARGDYIVFMDSDDYYPYNTTLEKLYGEAKKSGEAICGGTLVNYDMSRNVYFTPDKQEEAHKKPYSICCTNSLEKQASVYQKHGLIRYTDYQFNCYFSRFMYKRVFLIENNLFFPPYLRYEDPPFLVNAMLKAKTYYRIPDVTYIYRTSYKEIIWTVEKMTDMLKGIVELIMLAEKQHFEILRQREYADLNWVIDALFMNNAIKDIEKSPSLFLCRHIFNRSSAKVKKTEVIRDAWARLERRQKGRYLIKSCVAFPWYIYKTYCLIYYRDAIRRITPLLALKAWLFFPYFAVKTYVGIAEAYR